MIPISEAIMFDSLTNKWRIFWNGSLIPLDFPTKQDAIQHFNDKFLGPIGMSYENS